MSGAPVVILCGFMATGKTAVGRALARLLGVAFVDTDALIEAEEGMSIAELFERHGEAHFRTREKQVCAALDPHGGAVIATGGGMPVDPGNRERLNALGTTVLLEASIDAIVARTRGDRDRPLLANDSGSDVRELIASLLSERREAYHSCALHIDTTSRTPEESAFDVREMLLAPEGGAMVPLRVDTRPLPGRTPHEGNTRLSRIVVGQGAAAGLGEWLERLELATSVCFLSPPHIARNALPRITPGLEEHGITWHAIEVDDGDANKSLDQVSRLVDALAGAGAARDTVAVTVGGGVTGDTGGFAASIYMRGLPFVQIPTSLLAQVDASVGGKVGVNHPRAKNLVGAVYQPHLVLTDPSLLATLPEREFANGMAEVIKTAIIDDVGGAALFDRLCREPLRPDSRDVTGVVAACVRAKARVVERDPYERDRRRVLNLGHTLGHALEAALSYRGLAHGEAVGLGLLAAWRVALARGVADQRWVDATRDVLAAHGLPTQVPDVGTATVRDALGLDKKRRSGALTFVLPVEPGRVVIVDDADEDEIMAALDDRPPTKGRR